MMRMSQMPKHKSSPDAFLVRAMKPFVEAYMRGDNPGWSDLDNEQPINISVTLGDLRRAMSAYHQAAGEFSIRDLKIELTRAQARTLSPKSEDIERHRVPSREAGLHSVAINTELPDD